MCAAALLVAPLAGQEIRLDRFDVTVPAPVGGAAAGVTSASVRTHLPVDVAALLSRELPALVLVRRGGVASDLYLRGLGRDNVTVTLDGAPAYGACPGRMDPPVFHVSSVLVEHITVYPGPFDVRVGAAPGGSIAVETVAPPAQPAVTAGLAAGAADLWAGDLAAGGPLGGGWRGLAAVSYEEGRAYRDGSGRRITALAGLNYRPERQDRLAFRIGHGEIRAAWQGAADCGGEFHAAVNDGRDVDYPALQMDAQRDRSQRLAAGWHGASVRPWAARWRCELYHQRVDHEMSDAFRTSSLGAWAARGYMMRTVASTANYGANLVVAAAPGDQTWEQGLQVAVRRWAADNVVGGNANAMLPDVTVHQIAGYAQASRVTGPWKLAAGVRGDAWRSRAARDIAFVRAAQGTRLNRRVDAALSGYFLAERRWSPNVAAFAGIGRGARLPDPQERYISVDRPGAGTDWVGNPRLGVVRSTEGTAGVRWQGGGAHLHARAFHSRLTDYVLLARLTPAPGATANPLRTESYAGINACLTGLEIAAGAPLGAGWSLAAGAAGQRGRKLSQPPGGRDPDLPEIPPWNGRLVLRWERSGTWAEAEARWMARQTRPDADAGERPLGGHGVLHLRLEHAFGPRLTVSAGVDNLFNRTYATHNAYTRDPFAAGLILNEPGRFAYAQLRWRR